MVEKSVFIVNSRKKRPVAFCRAKGMNESFSVHGANLIQPAALRIDKPDVINKSIRFEQ